MPAFAGSLPRPELDAVVAYVANLNGIAYSPTGRTESAGGGAAQPKEVLSADAKRGQDCFRMQCEALDAAHLSRSKRGSGYQLPRRSRAYR
jgi:cytochrome c